MMKKDDIRSRVQPLVAKAHKAAVKLKGREYQRLFVDQLLNDVQDEFDMKLSQSQIETFDSELWKLIERWNNYEGRKLNLGQFLKVATNYTVNFVAMIRMKA